MKEKIEQYQKELRELENNLVIVIGNIALLEQRKETINNEMAKRYFAIDALSNIKETEVK